ncbi:MAG: hypothetical protein L6R38_005038 [Xanthoria sp. 2 TBL-2021]|nr:MAG: hypothetical protein L6R38_005038 [Xanthoria sp. 2 TBL-2021]
MPGSRMTKKLLKNPNDLKEVAEHLRPRGSYDPLPPPGGFPLPHYIRRKFSFAPQVPNVSKISLMPDFASSSLDLGIEIDDSEARGISHDTPISLWVRYSLESLRERNARNRQQITSKPSLPRLNTNLPSNDKIGRHESDVAVRTQSYNHHHLQQPALRHSRSIRRSRGQESLRHRRTSAASTTRSESSSEYDTLGFNARSTTTMTPQTALSLADEKIHHLTSTDEVEARLLSWLAEVVPNLFGSFCIIDLQLPGYPIRVTSHDMLPVDLAPDEVLFLDSSHLGHPYQVETVSNGSQKLEIVSIVADLVDIRGSSAQPSHLVVGQVDLTEFMCSQPELDEDVWLALAYEEMDKAGVRRTYPRPGSVPRNLILKGSEAERGIEVIRSLHRDYFIIGMSDGETREFGITMVSPTLYASKEVRGKEFLDFARLKTQLNTPQRFVTRVQWQTAGQRDKLYCVPMSGPHLVCWLCFLVHSHLPDIWP